MAKDTNFVVVTENECYNPHRIKQPSNVSRRAVLKIGAAVAAALVLGVSLEKPITVEAAGSCPADAIFYWVDKTGTFESWARPIEDNIQFGEHFNVVLHRITDPSTNYLFNYHVQYDGVQTLSDGNDYHIYQAFDDVSQSYMPDIQLLADNYTDNYSIAYDALNQHAFDLANYSTPVTKGNINLDDLETTIQDVAESSYSLAEGGLGLAQDIFAQIVELLPL